MCHKSKSSWSFPLINIIKYYIAHHVPGPDEKLVSSVNFFCSKLLSIERDKVCCFSFLNLSWNLFENKNPAA